MQITPYVIVYFFLTFSLLYLAVKSTMKELKLFLGVIFVSLFFSAFEISLVSPELKFIFNQLKFLGIVFIAPAGFLFYSKFLNPEMVVSKPKLAVFLSIPVITIFVIATNNFHHLFLSGYEIKSTPYVSYVLFYEKTWFWVHSLYAYIIIVCAVTILIIGVFKKHRMYRGQNYAMLFGTSVTIFLNVLVILKVITSLGDISVMAFSLTGICNYWAVYLYKPTGVINMARSFAINNIQNPILIFNNKDVLLDANFSAHSEFDLKNLTYVDILEIFSGNKQIEYKNKIYNSVNENMVDEKGVSVGRVVVFNDITNIKKSLDKQEYLLSHDSLTGLMSRLAFKNKLVQIIKKENLPIGILYFNIAGMKVINNIFGNEFGDEIIKSVGSIIDSEVSNCGIVAKMNGDEFSALIFNATEEQVNELKNRIINRCAEKDKFEIFVGVYVGYSFMNDQKENFDNLFKEAIGHTYRKKLIFAFGFYSEIFESLEVQLSNSAHETEGHIVRLKDLCTKVAVSMNYTVSEIKNINLLALTHDIGLLNSSDKFLEKEGSLTNYEWEEYKLHTVRGYNIALATTELIGVAECILSHHERFDGFGYPHRKKGNDIPEMSRILAVIDFYDGQLYPKKNVKPKAKAEVIKEIEKNAGSMFDPRIVEHFISVVSALEN